LERGHSEAIAGTPWTESEISAVVDSYFHFRNRAQMFEIAPPLEQKLFMAPTIYSAELK